MKKKFLITSILSIVMCMSLIAGATFALFTSESNVNISVTSGTVQVNAVAEIDNSNTNFGLGGSAAINGSNVVIDKIMPMDYVTVNVKIENESDVDVKYRAIIESTDSNALANELKVTIGGEDFKGLAYTEWTKLTPETDGETIVVKIALPTEATEGQGQTCSYNVRVEAVQGNANVTAFNDRAKNGEYTIYDKVDLYQFAKFVNSGKIEDVQGTSIDVKLMADIDLGGAMWTPIGTIGSNGNSTNFDRSFKGTFDGQNFTVSNYKVTSYGWAGLFGLAHTAEIKNLKVYGVELAANRMAGGVVGQLYGSITNVHAQKVIANVVPNAVAGGYDNGDKVGGIVGWLGDNDNNRTINNCTVKDITLNAYRDVGGIAGYAAESTTGSNNEAEDVNITADQSVNYYGNKNFCAGGIVGRPEGDVSVEGTETGVQIKTIGYALSTEAAQQLLDSAMHNLTIKLAPNVAFDTLYIRPTAKNQTTMYCETHNYTTSSAKEFKDHLAENGYHTTPKYTTTIKDVKIIGAEGATVAGFIATSGHAYGDVYDYVLDKDYDVGSAYYLTLNINNLTFEKVDFIGKIDINTSDADSVYDGVKFVGCSFTTGGTAAANGAAIRYYNESNNGNVKNISVVDCDFNNCYQGIYVHHVNGVTVTGCEFDTTGHNAIAIQSGDKGAVNLKDVVITGNTFDNIGDRIIRFGEIGADSNITIQNNVATNSGDEDDEVMKAVSIADGITTNISNNSWGDGKKVANDELKDN